MTITRAVEAFAAPGPHPDESITAFCDAFDGWRDTSSTRGPVPVTR